MRLISKSKLGLIGLGLLALVVSACGGGSSSSTTTTQPAQVSLTGVAVKGPFVAGSTVTATKLNNDGTASASTKSTTTTDNLGNYELPSLGWTGLTKVAITGNYFNEVTGDSYSSGTVSAIVNIEAAAGSVSSATVNPNVATTIASKVVEDGLAIQPTADPATLTKIVESSDAVVAEALGLPASVGGKPVKLAALNLLATSDTYAGAANKQLLMVSASLQDSYANGAGTATSVDALMASIVTDIKSGVTLGTTSGTTMSDPYTIAGKVATNISAVITKAVADAYAADPAAIPAIVVDTALTADVYAAATVVKNTAATTLRGLAMANNNFTVGTQTFVVDTYGKATVQAGADPYANALSISFTLLDYTGVAGTVTVKDLTVGFMFDAYASADSRMIQGLISPVTLTLDGTGQAAVTVPAGAVLNYTGVDSQGVTASGTATNVAANVITANASVITIDANALLATIQNRVGDARFDLLSTAGTFDFGFSIAGVNVGHDNTAGGLNRLFPVSAYGGRELGGRVTTK